MTIQIETEDIPQLIRARVSCDLRPVDPATTVVQARLKTDMIGYAVCSEHVERAMEILKYETCWTCEMPTDACPCTNA